VLEEIRQRFAEIWHPAYPQDLSCTFSCGIAELSAHDDSKDLSKHADQALYRAKHAGRNRSEIFTR
jgi:PleD family two-component response regulator